MALAEAHRGLVDDRIHRSQPFDSTCDSFGVRPQRKRPINNIHHNIHGKVFDLILTAERALPHKVNSNTPRSMPPRKPSPPASPSTAGGPDAFLDAMKSKLPYMSTPPSYSLSAAGSSAEASPEPATKRKRTATGSSKLKEEVKAESLASEYFRERDRALVANLFKDEDGRPEPAVSERKRKRLAAEERGKLGEPWRPEEDYAMFCAIFPKSGASRDVWTQYAFAHSPTASVKSWLEISASIPGRDTMVSRYAGAFNTTKRFSDLVLRQSLPKASRSTQAILARRPERLQARTDSEAWLREEDGTLDGLGGRTLVFGWVRLRQDGCN